MIIPAIPRFNSPQAVSKPNRSYGLPFSGALGPVPPLAPLKAGEFAHGPLQVGIHLEAALKAMLPKLPWLTGLSLQPATHKPGAWQISGQVGSPYGPMPSPGGPPQAIIVSDRLALLPRRQQPVSGRGIRRMAIRIARDWRRQVARHLAGHA